MPTPPSTQAHSPPTQPSLVDAIDQCLPQTQCNQCDYAGCWAYARAIASGEAKFNQCPPGGEISIRQLARLLQRETIPLNRKHGHPKPLHLASIHEADCIGCTLCIAVCPVDCIIGAAKRMHTVISNDCSGCELCVPVCPTDCITMLAPTAATKHVDASATSEHVGLESTDADASTSGEPSLWCEFSQSQVEKFRARAQQKRIRIAAQQRARSRQRRHRQRSSLQSEILAAVQRKQAQQQQA